VFLPFAKLGKFHSARGLGVARSQDEARGGYKRDAVRRVATRALAALGPLPRTALGSRLPPASLERSERRTREKGRFSRSRHRPPGKKLLQSLARFLGFASSSRSPVPLLPDLPVGEMFPESILLVVVTHATFHAATAMIGNDHRQQQVNVSLECAFAGES